MENRVWISKTKQKKVSLFVLPVRRCIHPSIHPIISYIIKKKKRKKERIQWKIESRFQKQNKKKYLFSSCLSVDASTPPSILLSLTLSTTTKEERIQWKIEFDLKNKTKKVSHIVPGCLSIRTRSRCRTWFSIRETGSGLCPSVPVCARLVRSVDCARWILPGVDTPWSLAPPLQTIILPPPPPPRWESGGF